MKIETNILVDFITKIQMKNIETCLFNFTEDGLLIKTAALDASCMCEGFLKKEAFTEYVPLGEVGIDNLTKLTKVLKRLGKELSFEVEGNCLSAKGNKKELSFELVAKQFITESRDLPELEYADEFKIEVKKLIEIFNDAQMNKDVLLSIKTVKDGVQFSNTGKYKFTHNIESEGTKGGHTVKFGQPIIDALSTLTAGNLICKTKTDFPLEVSYSDDITKLRILVAPRVDKGE